MEAADIEYHRLQNGEITLKEYFKNMDTNKTEAGIYMFPDIIKLDNKALNAVMLATNVKQEKDKLFIVWSCYILGNRKYLIGSKLNNAYYEVTYNVQKDEWYIDEYVKKCNTYITDEELEVYSNINKPVMKL